MEMAGYCITQSVELYGSLMARTGGRDVGWLWRGACRILEAIGGKRLHGIAAFWKEDDGQDKKLTYAGVNQCS
jgi:hypothetical protein